MVYENPPKWMWLVINGLIDQNGKIGETHCRIKKGTRHGDKITGKYINQSAFI